MVRFGDIIVFLPTVMFDQPLPRSIPLRTAAGRASVHFSRFANALPKRWYNLDVILTDDFPRN